MGNVKLTQKQKIFCDEYLIDLNATRAYKAAYTNETAAAAGARLLRNVKVESYINQKMKEREKRTEITQDKVLRELAKIGTAKLSDYLEYKTAKSIIEYDEDGEPVIDYRPIIDVLDSKEVDTSAIQEVSISKDGTFKFKLYDKQKALELIGRHLGMFNDKLELQGKVETNNPLAGLTTEELKKLIK